nr:hypothetical protein B0A51_10870 [Rachicladosporium sp. CCFEE 5018]
MSNTKKSQQPAPRAVAAPKPQVEDVRTFQVGQIQRRFKPTTDERDHATVFTFQMIPTDPDFPYEIDALDCSLEIPHGYPDNGRPLLRILNKDIPRGFQINIENGFHALCDNAPGATLLGLMNRLDKQLESILSGEMAQTVKLVVNRGPPKPTAVPVPSASVTTPLPRLPALQGFTSEQRADAEKKRQSDTRQLEARFGRLQHFAKSPDGFSYTLPIDSPKRQSWPASLRSLRSFTLLLPALYPLEASTIMLDEESKEARNVETAFEARSEDHLDATLTQQVNYLTQHLHEMAKDREQEPNPRPAQVATPQKTVTLAQTGVLKSTDPDRPHLHVIERPPEWTMIGGTDDESDLSSSDGYSYDSGDDIEDSHDSEDGGAPVSAPIEKGVLISFPQLELYGIELMELTTLNISVKCERCKDIMDVERLHNTSTSGGTGIRDASCKKCTTRFSVGFRADLMHANSVRAGYLDLDGCTVVDMLPSSFIPTCTECSTPHPAPGVVSVRGESTMAICRECHKKTSFRIPEVKFLQISAAAIRASKAPIRKKSERSGGAGRVGKSVTWEADYDMHVDSPAATRYLRAIAATTQQQTTQTNTPTA